MTSRTLPIVATCLACLGSATPALADDSRKFDLTFERPGNPDIWVRPTGRMDIAFFTSSQAYAGDTRRNLGNDYDGYMELGFVPGIDAQLGLGDNGTLRGRLSGVWTTTQIGTDGAGSTLADDGDFTFPEELTLEDFYIGWNSGKLFAESLGENALDLSFGSQSYRAGPSGPDGDGLGSGFLFYDGGSDGDNRGGFWLGLRSSFQMAFISKLQTGHFDAQGVFLRSDELDDLNTAVLGLNLGYSFAEMLDLELARMSIGYYGLPHSDDDRRDGLNVINLGVDVKPLRTAPGLRITGEVVLEKNGDENESFAAWAELGYEFDCAWKPHVSYRIAHFSGDDGTGDTNNNFDALFVGFSDWNYWFLGEISGEYLTRNSNLQAHIGRIRVNPLDSLTLNLFYIYQRLDERQQRLSPRPPLSTRSLVVRDKDLSHEINFIVDWAPNAYLSFSGVAAYLIPLAGGEDFFGGDNTWQNYMLYASVRF